MTSPESDSADVMSEAIDLERQLRLLALQLGEFAALLVQIGGTGNGS